MPDVTLHAVNLINPSHMEWTLDGRLLVSQSTAGSVVDATRGGNMLDAIPYASGLRGPASILPRKTGEILVAEMWGGTVRDISSGGDVSDNDAWIDRLSGPYSLAEKTDEGGTRTFVTESYNGRDAWLSEITDEKLLKRRIDNIPVKPGFVGQTPLDSWPSGWQKYALGNCVKNWQDTDSKSNSHYLAISDMGQVLEITDADGDYMSLIKEKRAIAWGLGQVGALKHHPHNGLLYITQPSSGEIYALNPDKPQNYHFLPPVVKGFKYPSCIRFSPDGSRMYVCDQADGVIWQVQDFDRGV